MGKQTKGKPKSDDPIGDAFSKAYDAMAEEARALRMHMCLKPLHVDVSRDFLEDARRFALAVDAFEQAEDALMKSVDEEASHVRQG
jgi:hypothetical protein